MDWTALTESADLAKMRLKVEFKPRDLNDMMKEEGIDNYLKMRICGYKFQSIGHVEYQTKSQQP